MFIRQTHRIRMDKGNLTKKNNFLKSSSKFDELAGLYNLHLALASKELFGGSFSCIHPVDKPKNDNAMK